MCVYVCVCVCTFSYSFPWWFITRHWIYFPALHSRTLLLIHPVYNRLRPLIPNSQSFPSPLPPPWQSMQHLLSQNIYFSSVSQTCALLSRIHDFLILPNLKTSIQKFKRRKFSSEGSFALLKKAQNHTLHRGSLGPHTGLQVSWAKPTEACVTETCGPRGLLLTKPSYWKILFSLFLPLCLLKGSVFFLSVKFLLTCSSWSSAQQWLWLTLVCVTHDRLHTLTPTKRMLSSTSLLICLMCI